MLERGWVQKNEGNVENNVDGPERLDRVLAPPPNGMLKKLRLTE
jgi:hypothetical protein